MDSFTPSANAMTGTAVTRVARGKRTVQMKKKTAGRRRKRCGGKRKKAGAMHKIVRRTKR